MTLEDDVKELVAVIRNRNKEGKKYDKHQRKLSVYFAIGMCGGVAGFGLGFAAGNSMGYATAMRFVMSLTGM